MYAGPLLSCRWSLPENFTDLEPGFIATLLSLSPPDLHVHIHLIGFWHWAAMQRKAAAGSAAAHAASRKRTAAVEVSAENEERARQALAVSQEAVHHIQ